MPTLLEKRIFLICGLTVAAFILSLAFLAWREGLWTDYPTPVTHAPPIAAPIADTAPTAAAALAPAAMNPPAVVTSPPPAQSEPPKESESPPAVDDDEATPARRERGTGRDSRSR